MRKLVALMVVFVVCSVSMFAEQDDRAPSPLVVGTGLSVGVFPTPSTSDGWSDLVQFAQTVASIRGAIDLQYTVPVDPVVWLGAGAGLSAMSLNLGSQQVIFLDLPLRVVAKWGFDTTFVEVFAGDYLSLMPVGESPPLGGPELGSRLALDGFYVEAALVWGSTTWTRYGLGWVNALP